MPKNEVAELPVYYMKMTSDNVDARLGKLKVGQVVAMDEAKATRYLTAGVAEQTTKADFDKQQDRKNEKATAAQNAFRSLNDGGAIWDVATYRDVLTAPEKGLRMAFERGVSLVNVHMLRDEDGDPLPPDADIEDILDARMNLHPDLQAPFAAHERSSVMGGGSPYVSNVNPGIGTPAPLNPMHRAMMEKIQQQEMMAQRPADYSYDRNDPDAKRERATANDERANRAARRATPRTPVSPKAEEAARDAGVTKPATGDLSDEQKA